ncbi:hypothetical protein NQZ68_012252 [Dissostichus eleginoides]|nr:hypothetical protein NQZ68_012252 [Dissostichus eleginoides]
MTISIHFALLVFLVTQDFTSCINMTSILEFVDVALGDSLTLNCTYNCSSGFVRGCWSKANQSKSGAFVDCLGNSSKSSLCTTSLHLSILSTKDRNKNYSCYTQHTDDPRLPQNIAGIVVLQLKAKTSVQNGIVTPKTATRNASNPAEQNDSSGALAIFLCLNRNRQCWTDKGEPVGSRSGSPLPLHAVPSPVKGTVSTKSERVTLRIPTPDNESDTEVPYADITIAVRGVSTPELTQVGYLTPGDQQEWWGDEPRSHLQASRSADRLHVPQPREVSRKMSTNSEYAVITYA